jgi:predicted nucleic-acid-binding protein
MKTCFIDTNLFIRYLTNDDPQKADRVERLLAQAAGGKVKLVSAEMVLAEVVWVLESYYQLEKTQIAEMVKAILATPGLEVLNGKIVQAAIPYYAQQNIDFIDAYIISVMQKRHIEGIYSFDRKHLDRVTAITRLEP